MASTLMKYLFGLLFLMIFLVSCTQQISVKGKINGMPEIPYTVYELGFDNNVKIDSGMTGANGEFSFKHKAKEEALYRVKLGDSKFILLVLNNGEKAEVTGDWNSIQNYGVIGSPGSMALKSYMINLRESMKNITTLSMILDSVINQHRSDSLKQSVEADYRKENELLVNYVKKFADTTLSVSCALFAANSIKAQFEGPFLTQFYQNITKRFPSSTVAKQFADKYLAQQASSSGEKDFDELELNQPAPDFTATTPNGSKLSLSNFKGKFVLVDFWASWCPPCRKENPNVVKAFERFKDKNFSILGVSLDSEKENWMKAITKDNLIWDHVSELKGWQSAIARNYHVEEIPFNVLVNPEGNIIGMNLMGDELMNKLQEVLK